MQVKKALRARFGCGLLGLTAALALPLAAAAGPVATGVSVPDSALREGSIASFETVLDRYPDSAMRAPVLLLLGDLYAGREKSRYLGAVLRHEEDVAAGRASAVPVLDYSEAVRSFREAARLAEGSAASVEALHALGVCFDEMGRKRQAERSLLEAARRATDPALRAASLLRLGDLRFSSADWGGAIEAYRGAREAGADPGLEKLDYRIGWCRLKRGELEEAGACFMAALQRALRTDLGDSPRESLSEVLRSLALVQVETDPTDLKGFSSRFPRGAVRRAAVAELGEVLLDHDRPAQAERAFRVALRMDPDGADAPDVHDRIVEALGAEDRKAEAGREMEKYVALYAPASAWWAGRDTTGDFVSDIKERVRRNCWNAALLRYESGTDEDLLEAALLFGRYAGELGGLRERSRALLFAAEAWDRLGEVEKSAASYGQVVPDELPEEEREFAFRGAVLTQQALGGTGDGFSRAALRYAEAYPGSEEAWKSVLLAAEREESAGRLPAAFALCARAAEGAAVPVREDAEVRAARLAAQIGDRVAAEEWYLRAARSAPEGKEHRDRLERAAASAFLAAGDLEKEGRWSEAAGVCARVFREYRSTSVGGDALVEEVACRARFDPEETVLALADTAATLRPGSEEARRGIGAAAMEASRAGRPLLAARLHETAYRVLPGPEDLLGAGASYEAAGDVSAARAFLEKAAASAAGTPLAPEALVRLGLRYRADGDAARAARAFDRARDEGGEARAVELLALAGAAWLDAGDARRAAERLERAVAIHEAGGAKGEGEELHAAEAYVSLARARTPEWEKELARWREGGTAAKSGRLLERMIGLYRNAIDLRFEGTTETAALEAGGLLEEFGRTALLRERDTGGVPSASLVDPYFRDALVLFRSAGDEGAGRLSPYADLADSLIDWGEKRIEAAPPPGAEETGASSDHADEFGPALDAIESAGEAWSVAADLFRVQEEHEGAPGLSMKRTSLALRAAEVLREGVGLLRAAPLPEGLSKKDLELYQSLVEEKARAFEEKASAWYLALPDAVPEVIPTQASRGVPGTADLPEGGTP